jgi:hypothetical protein
MGNAFHQGGWGMYPTAIAVLVTVATAIHFARQPSLRRESLVRGLMLLSFVTGALGTVTGCIKAFTSMEEATPINHALIGLGEALNCVAFGICGVVLGGIFLAVGRARLASRPNAEVLDPHPH